MESVLESLMTGNFLQDPAEESLVSLFGDSIDAYTKHSLASYESFIAALESDLAIQAAFESEGAEGETEDASENPGSMYKKAIKRLFAAQKKGDEAEVTAATAEVNKYAAQLEAEGKTAKTPEEIKKHNKHMKIALVAGAGITAGLGALGVGGHLAEKNGGSNSNNPALKFLAAIGKGENAVASGAINVLKEIPKRIRRIGISHTFKKLPKEEQSK